MSIKATLQGVSRKVADALFPPLCINCNKDGSYVCDDCFKDILWIDPYYACRKCGAPYGRLTCTCCKHQGEFDGCVCAVGSNEIALKIVKTYKNGPEVNLAPFIASAIVISLEMAELEGVLSFNLSEVDGVCWIPARYEAMIRRGFDHMELIARMCASLLDVAVVECLSVDEVEDQRSLDRNARIDNMRGSMHVTQNVNGLNLLLIDDVITTGATILAARDALICAGARLAMPVAFCRVW